MSKVKARSKDYISKQQQAALDASDDDSSGGGHGKKMLGHFKLENLLTALEKGRYKAEQFWRFLNKEGLDSHEIEKSEIAKQTEAKEEKAEANKDKSEQETESTVFAADEERSNQYQTTSEAERRYTFLEQSYTGADATRRSIIGDKIAGSVISGTTNPLGFTRSTELTGSQDFSAAVDMAKKASIGAAHFSWMSQDNSGHAKDGLQGSGMQGSVTNAAYFGNSSGVTEQSGMAGRLFNPLQKAAEKTSVNTSPKESFMATAATKATAKP